MPHKREETEQEKVCINEARNCVFMYSSHLVHAPQPKTFRITSKESGNTDILAISFSASFSVTKIKSP